MPRASKFFNVIFFTLLTLLTTRVTDVRLHAGATSADTISIAAFNIQVASA